MTLGGEMDRPSLKLELLSHGLAQAALPVSAHRGPHRVRAEGRREDPRLSAQVLGAGAAQAPAPTHTCSLPAKQPACGCLAAGRSVKCGPSQGIFI